MSVFCYDGQDCPFYGAKLICKSPKSRPSMLFCMARGLADRNVRPAVILADRDFGPREREHGSTEKRSGQSTLA